MKNFIKKIGLSTSLTTELLTDRNTFMNKLNQVIGKPSNNFLDVFPAGRKEYFGTVNYDSFKIKRRQFTSYQSQMQASAIGKVYQKGDKLVIESEITVYSHFLLFFLSLILFFYIVIIIGILYSGGLPFLIIPIFFVHGIFMVLLPYRMLKRSVKKLKYDLEREFFYLAR